MAKHVVKHSKPVSKSKKKFNFFIFILFVVFIGLLVFSASKIFNWSKDSTSISNEIADISNIVSVPLNGIFTTVSCPSSVKLFFIERDTYIVSL